MAKYGKGPEIKRNSGYPFKPSQHEFNERQDSAVNGANAVLSANRDLPGRKFSTDVAMTTAGREFASRRNAPARTVRRSGSGFSRSVKGRR